MSDSSEWREWSESYRSAARGEVLAPQLAAAVRRRERRLRRLVLAEVALTVLGLGAALAWFAASPSALRGAAVTLFATCFAVAWAFNLWNRRGSYRAAGESVEAHLAFAERRARGQRRTLAFVPLFFAFEVAAILLFHARFSPQSLPLASGLAAVAAALGGLGWALYRDRVLGEQARLARLRRELGDPSD